MQAIEKLKAVVREIDKAVRTLEDAKLAHTVARDFEYQCGVEINRLENLKIRILEELEAEILG